MKFKFVFVLWGIRLLGFAKGYDDLDINDWYNPTLSDYHKLQNYLFDSCDEDLNIIDDPYRVKRIKNFKLIHSSHTSVPKLQKFPINVSPMNRDTCIITYASANLPYVYYPFRLLKQLRMINFEGHFLFQIGGCPNLSEGSLKYFDTPYAFKVNMFKEAMKLGFKYVIWIDCALIPLSKQDLDYVIHCTKNLNALLVQHTDTTEVSLGMKELSHKYLIEKNHIREALDYPLESAVDYIHMNTKVIGLNMQSSENIKLINLWQKLAAQKVSFLSAVPEEYPFSILVKKLNIPFESVSFYWVVRRFPDAKR